MNAHFHILKPIWNGNERRREVGLAQYKMTTETLDITIGVVNKQGEKLYPYLYQISREKALKYPTQTWKGTILRIIPIRDLRVAGEELRMYLL